MPSSEAMLCSDMDVLQTAQEAAAKLLEDDPLLQRPENGPLLEHIRKLFTLHEETFN